MKEIKIYFARSLEDFVIKSVKRIGIKNFMLLSGMSGFSPEKNFPMYGSSTEMEYNVSLLLIYGDGGLVEKIKEALLEFNGECEIRPCIKMVVSDVEELI